MHRIASNLVKRSWVLVALIAGWAMPAAPVHAQDPVAKLRQALLMVSSELEPNPMFLANRRKLIESSIKEMKSIAELRRAYFLKEWAFHGRLDKPNKQIDVDHYRSEIGDKLIKAVHNTAKEQDPERQLAVAILIAELGESEQPLDRRGKGKFARAFTDIARNLTKEKDVAVKQAAFHALGKVTPKPGDAVPVMKEALEKESLGPRRLAAYALSDLVRNAHYLRVIDEERDKKKPAINEELQTIDLVIAAAAVGLRDADEPVRGYCLQAMLESGRALTDYLSTAAYSVVEEEKGKQTFDPNLRAVLKTMQTANPQILQSLGDPKINVRLTAMQALDQFGVARAKLQQILIEYVAEPKPDKRGQLWEPFDAPDPLANIVERDWRRIAKLLKEDDARLRRGAIDFLEQLGDQVEPAAVEVGDALRDPDPLVRWTAVRTIRSIPAKKVTANAIKGLGALVTDPDPNISADAARTIEALGVHAADAVDSLTVAIAEGDAENRILAMKALVSIGGEPATRAIPKVIETLNDTDVRIRRAGAETLGRFGADAKDALPALRNALRDEDAEVRLSASEAILSISTPKKPL